MVLNEERTINKGVVDHSVQAIQAIATKTLFHPSKKVVIVIFEVNAQKIIHGGY